MMYDVFPSNGLAERLAFPGARDGDASGRHGSQQDSG